MPAPVVYRTELSGLTRIHEGKVRDIYAVDDDSMLIVTTDRLSAFDVVLPDPIPDKGRVLNGISNFWFARTRHLVPNHLTSRDPAEVDAYVSDPACGFNLNDRSRESARIAWERIGDPSALARIRRDLPIYILAGDADPVNQNLEYLKPVAERYRAAGLTDISEKYYPAGRHEMFNEINRDEVLRDLRDWLRRVIPA